MQAHKVCSFANLRNNTLRHNKEHSCRWLCLFTDLHKDTVTVQHHKEHSMYVAKFIPDVHNGTMHMAKFIHGCTQWYHAYGLTK